MISLLKRWPSLFPDKETVSFWAQMILMPLAVPFIFLFWCLFFGVVMTAAFIFAGFIMIQIIGEGYFHEGVEDAKNHL